MLCYIRAVASDRYYHIMKDPLQPVHRIESHNPLCLLLPLLFAGFPICIMPKETCNKFSSSNSRAVVWPPSSTTSTSFYQAEMRLELFGEGILSLSASPKSPGWGLSKRYGVLTLQGGCSPRRPRCHSQIGQVCAGCNPKHRTHYKNTHPLHKHTHPLTAFGAFVVRRGRGTPLGAFVVRRGRGTKKGKSKR
jgi:hypothetical protein